jgi:toxin ParE1/3/4
VARITRRPRADDDLADIWLHVARGDPAAADRLLGEIEAALNRLADFPLSGRARPELAPDLRSVPVRRYVLFYLPAPGGVDLVRVLHGARDLEAELGED